MYAHKSMMFDESVRFEYLGNNPSSDIPICRIVIFSIIFHSLLFYLLPSKLSPLNKSYVVSTCHAIVSVCSVTNFFARYSTNFKQMNRIAGGGVIGTGDEIMTYSICYSLGYFIYDFFLMLAVQSVRTSAALIHHILVLIGVSSGMIYRICHPCHFYLLGEELSTIALNLKSIYHDRPRLHRMLTPLFVGTFFLSRLIYGSIICGYALEKAPRFFRLAWNLGDWKSFLVGLLQAALCILTRTLNFYWAVLILRKLRRSKQSKEKTSLE